MAELDFSERYKVESWNTAVAVYPTEYKKIMTEEEWIDDGEDDDGETIWIIHESEEVEDRDWVYVVMVGDDHRHLVEVSDLVLIEEGDYCPGCGQIGCKAYASE